MRSPLASILSIAAACAGAPSPKPPATVDATARPVDMHDGDPAGCAGKGRRVFEVTSTPELVMPASSPFFEVRLAMSPDGDTMLWGSTDRSGGPGGWNIWTSTRTAGAWSAPAPVSFNSEANDFDPAFSPDGGHVYFFSNRPGGLGGDDVYRVPVVPGGFGAVEHLDGSVNSAGDEWAPLVLRDGSLLFASDGRGGSGRHDLFVAAPRDAGFAPAELLPGALNSPADEFDATVLPDGDIVFSRSANVESDPIVLVFAHRGPAGYDHGTPLPATVNVDGGATLGPALDFRDPSILYFTGKRLEAAAGKLDIYRVRYRAGCAAAGTVGQP
jgi:hypothetical protein